MAHSGAAYTAPKVLRGRLMAALHDAPFHACFGKHCESSLLPPTSVGLQVQLQILLQPSFCGSLFIPFPVTPVHCIYSPTQRQNTLLKIAMPAQASAFGRRTGSIPYRAAEVLPQSLRKAAAAQRCLCSHDEGSMHARLVR